MVDLSSLPTIHVFHSYVDAQSSRQGTDVNMVTLSVHRVHLLWVGGREGGRERREGGRERREGEEGGRERREGGRGGRERREGNQAHYSRQWTRAYLITILLHCEAPLYKGLEEVFVELQVTRGENTQVAHHVVSCGRITETLQCEVVIVKESRHLIDLKCLRLVAYGQWHLALLWSPADP